MQALCGARKLALARAVDVEQRLAQACWGPGQRRPPDRLGYGERVLVVEDGWATAARDARRPECHGGTWAPLSVVTCTAWGRRGARRCWSQICRTYLRCSP